MVRAIQKHRADIVVNQSVAVQDETTGKTVKRTWGRLKEGLHAPDVKCFYFPWEVWGKIYKKSFLDKINLSFPEISHNSDLYSHAVVFANISSFYVINASACYHYSVRAGSLQTQAPSAGRDAASLRVNSLIHGYLKENNLLAKGKINIMQLKKALLDSKDKDVFYQQLRLFFLNIKPDAELNKKSFYQAESEFFYRVLNNQNYKDFTADTPRRNINFNLWSAYRSCGN
jgi:hypothetical protein